jgi:hypothetical protein
MSSTAWVERTLERSLIREVAVAKSLEVGLVEIEKFHTYLEEFAVYSCGYASAIEAVLHHP